MSPIHWVIHIWHVQVPFTMSHSHLTRPCHRYIESFTFNISRSPIEWVIHIYHFHVPDTLSHSHLTFPGPRYTESFIFYISRSQIHWVIQGLTQCLSMVWKVSTSTLGPSLYTTRATFHRGLPSIYNWIKPCINRDRQVSWLNALL